MSHLGVVVHAAYDQDFLAERVGFEPTEGFPSHDFQSCRFGRSRTPPGVSFPLD